MNAGAIVAALRPGVKDWFGLTYKDLPEEWKEIVQVMPSNMAYEKLASISAFPVGVVRDEGEATSYVGTQQFITPIFTHLTYALGFILTRQHISDNVYMPLAEQKTKALARSMIKAREYVCANLLVQATNAAATMQYGDGVSLANTAHPLGRGGTYSNMLSVGAPLSEASLEQLCIQIQKTVDDANTIISLQPRKLIVTPESEYEACRILKSDYRVGTPNNDINALKYRGKLPEGFVINHFMPNNTQFWGIKTDAENGLIYFDRWPLEIDNDADFDTENVKFKAVMRFSTGWGDARGFFLGKQ